MFFLGRYVCLCTLYQIYINNNDLGMVQTSPPFFGNAKIQEEPVKATCLWGFNDEWMKKL